MVRVWGVHLTKPFTMKWIPIAALLLLGCGMERGNGYNKFLDPCNKVQIVVFNGGDSLFFDTQDSTGIEILSAQVSGNPDPYKDTCAAEGYLRYLRDSTVLLEARFAASPNSCRYIAYQNDGYAFAHRLSERATNLLQKVVQQGGAPK